MASARDTLQVRAPAGQVFEAAEKALREMGATVETGEVGQLMIVARMGMSFKTWGERMTISIVEAIPGVSTVRVHSKVRFPIQVIDWGKNDGNVQRFQETLTRILQHESNA